MRIAIIQASSQQKRNQLLIKATKSATGEHDQVINFGVFENDPQLSYVQVAVIIGILLNSGAIDYVITGCSSGNGMNIACNTMPNVISGYLPTPSDAYLFGRINQGNCASLPLGLNFGWAGELNLTYTLEKLFEGPMNTGYPKAMASRKKKDALKLVEIKHLAQNDMIKILEGLDNDFLKPIYEKTDLFQYLQRFGTNQPLLNYLSNII